MIKVGLTGGIGSGKSTVAKMFINLGVPVYFADDNAKRLMASSKVIKSKLIKEFGKETFVNGVLNKPYLANIIFNNKEKLQTINAIVHPSVGNSFKRWAGKQTSSYVIQENAILFENNKQDNFDITITVTAPKEIKINRVVKRDGVTKQQVLERMNNQLPDLEKIKQSDFVIENLQLQDTKAQVKAIHQKILEQVLKS